MFKKIILLLSILVLFIACDNSSNNSANDVFEVELSGGGLPGTYFCLIEFNQNIIVTDESTVSYQGTSHGSFTSGIIDGNGDFTAEMTIDSQVTLLTGTYNSGTDELSGTLLRNGVSGTFIGQRKVEGEE